MSEGVRLVWWRTRTRGEGLGTLFAASRRARDTGLPCDAGSRACLSRHARAEHAVSPLNGAADAYESMGRAPIARLSDAARATCATGAAVTAITGTSEATARERFGAVATTA